MVSVQTSGEGSPAGQLTQLSPPSTQPPTDDASNQHNQQHNPDAGVLHRKPVPSVLQPGLGSSVPPPPVPQIQHHDDDRDERPDAPMERIPSILRPGTGKSPNSNPFRNKAGIGALATLDLPEAMSKMQIASTTNNPRGSALHTPSTGLTSVPQYSRAQQQPMPSSAFRQDAWSRHDAAELDATPSSYARPTKPPGIPMPKGQSIQGDEPQNIGKCQADSQSTFVKPTDEFSHIFDDPHTWEDLGRTPKIKRSATIKTAVEDSDQDDWNIIGSEEEESITVDVERTPANDVRESETEVPTPLIPDVGAPAVPPTLHESQNEQRLKEPLIQPVGYETPVQASQPHHAPQTGGLVPKQQNEGPPLPPRQTEPSRRWSAGRQPVDGEAETYQIKKIRWNDPDYDKSRRVSPILVQNENGPCPLVALVNALSLTTPADTPETTLVQVLCKRERITLNLLLDAVVDELMSPRRTSYDDALPDISELYEFLRSLHTGMNVNPRFIPTPELVEAYKRSSLTHLAPMERDALMPGTFEDSLELKLYAAFSIPLIHGWLPAKSDPAYDAFERQAASYEDAQNLLFREEELDDKLLDPQGGLSGQEQQLYKDITAIKLFLNESATQLTPWGIEVISKAIRPGTFAILFRNDHFSTLYCHPLTMQLLTLVTDAGYNDHDEVVWESLKDVNGEMSALYSGDFRPSRSPSPGTPSAGPSLLNPDAGGDWPRLQDSCRGKDRKQDSDNMSMPSMRPGADHEQEDRDLALALQLQEEEEQNQREEQERQGSRFAGQVNEQQGRQQPLQTRRHSRRRSSPANRRPPPPPRPQTQNVRPLVPPATTAWTTSTTTTTTTMGGRMDAHRPAQAAVGGAPPPYEASRYDRRYEPGQGRGGGSSAPGGGGGGSHMAQVSGRYGSETAGHYLPPRAPMGARVKQGSGKNRDRDCDLM